MIDEINQHIGSIQQNYNVYAGSTYRAALRKIEGNRYEHIIGVMSLRRDSESHESTISNLVGKDFFFVEVQSDLAWPIKTLSNILDANGYVLTIGNDEIQVMMEEEKKTHDLEFNFLPRDQFLAIYGQDFGGFQYFLNFKRDLESVGVSKASLRAIGYDMFKPLVYHKIVNPDGTIPVDQRVSNTGIYLVLPNYHARIENTTAIGKKVIIDLAVSRDEVIPDLKLVIKAMSMTELDGSYNKNYPPMVIDKLEGKKVERDFPSEIGRLEILLLWGKGLNDSISQIDSSSWFAKTRSSKILTIQPSEDNAIFSGDNTENATMPDFRCNIHADILKVAKSLFMTGHYSEAVEAGFKEVNARVKRIVRQKMSYEKDGVDLMWDAFAYRDGKPIIPLSNELSTKSGKNEQEGYMHLFAGAMKGIRNPKAHANIRIGKDRAMHHLILASLLMYKLDESKCDTILRGGEAADTPP
jgi:uncharacterized protein (TIGR02391 family)